MSKSIELKEFLEGNTKIYYYSGKVSKSLPVFFNPNKFVERWITVFFAKAYFEKEFVFLDALAGTGIKALRLLTEVNKCNKAIINDINKKAFELIKKNIKINKDKLKNKIVEIYNKDANILVREITKKEKIDWIDIDPFGSPIPFLDSVSSAIASESILSVTATDCGVLIGKYPKKLYARYGIIGQKSFLAHEFGIRCLLKAVLENLMRYEKFMRVLFVFHDKHYYKVFVKVERRGWKDIYSYIDKNLGFVKVYNNDFEILPFEEIQIREGTTLKEIMGPIYIGPLFDKHLAKKIITIAKKDEIYKKIQILKNIEDEINIDTPFFFNLDLLSKELKKSSVSIKKVIELLRNNGFMACRTHFDKKGIKTNAKKKDIVELLKTL